MSAFSIARQHVSKINLALQEAGQNIVATLDPEYAYSLLTDGKDVALVEITNTEFETWTVQTHSIRYIVISANLDALASWERLDELTEKLREPLELDSAQLTMWQPPTGSPYPAVLLQTTESEID